MLEKGDCDIIPSMTPALAENTSRVEQFKRGALMAFTTALRAPLMLMMGCGYVNYNGALRALHDHNGKKIVVESFLNSVEYDAAMHGEILDFVNEGDRVPMVPNSTQGKVPTHRHKGTSSSGVYEYNYE